MTKRFLRALAGPALALFGLALPLAAQHRERPLEPLGLSFGVYQTDKATVMYKAFTPLLESVQDALSKSLGRPVDIQLTIFRSYDDGIDALARGTVDFVHFGPASYITAKARNPDLRLVAMEHENGEKRFNGVIVVGKDSPLQKIEELRGKRFAFGDRNSTIGRYLVQAELVQHGILLEHLADHKYMERHDQVAASVEHGDFDAGSIKWSTFVKFRDKGTLRALATFPNVTKPVVARAALDPRVFAALQEAFYSLNDPEVLKGLKISGFMPTSDEEYDFVRTGMKRAEEFDPATRG